MPHLCFQNLALMHLKHGRKQIWFPCTSISTSNSNDIQWSPLFHPLLAGLRGIIIFHEQKVSMLGLTEDFFLLVCAFKWKKSLKVITFSYIHNKTENCFYGKNLKLNNRKIKLSKNIFQSSSFEYLKSGLALKILHPLVTTSISRS